jgi:hypothetical protein
MATTEIKVSWKVHTPNLLQEVLNNNSTGILLRPLQLMGHLLAAVATRAAELNDRELNRLMLQLTLYEKADPSSKEYDPAVMKEYGL